jgi:uncharacterized protein YndB with AHSA1/START domain
MPSETTSGYELKLEQRLRAPVARVWAALTDAGQIARWYGPGDGFRIDVKEWDCRVGGSYRVAMHHPEGQTHTCHGVFRAIEPERRIAYTWAWEDAPPMETLVTFEIRGEGGDTQLTFTHAGFPAEEVLEQHRMGWTGSLAQLTKLVED